MHQFTYHRATSVADALAAFKGADDAAYLSGGHTLLPAMKQRLAAPSDVIDLTGLDELVGIAVDADAVEVGALTPHAVVAASAEVGAAIPALAALAGKIGDPQVRNKGTIGGSIANNDPAADYPAALVGLAATVVTERRRIAADDFFTGLFETALDEGEIVTSVRFLRPAKARGLRQVPQPRVTLRHRRRDGGGDGGRACASPSPVRAPASSAPRRWKRRSAARSMRTPRCRRSRRRASTPTSTRAPSTAPTWWA